MKNNNIINYSSHLIDQKDIYGVNKVLKSKFLTQGILERKFEHNLKKYFKVKNAIVCSSGTSAIHLAMLSLNIQKNDTVLMPVTNFISAYNVSSLIGCKIYYVDINKYSGLVDSDSILECIRQNNLKKINLIFVMHHGGVVCDLEGINKLKKKYNFKIIEDACHAFGSKYFYKGQTFKSGCSIHSDVTVFSFHAIKTITTAEGGALITNNNIIAKKAKLLKSHGIQRSKNHWQYDVLLNGFNYRLNEISCSLGITQLKKINKFVKYRKKVALFYFKKLKQFHNLLSLPEKKNLNLSCWHLFTISVNFSKFTINKKDLFIYMKKKKIYLQQHYIPINLFTCTQNKKKLRNSKFFFNNSFTLPIHCKIKKNDQIIVIKELVNFLQSNIKNKEKKI